MLMRAHLSEPDPRLRHLEREAVVACLVLTGVSLVVAAAPVRAAVSVLVGGGLVWFSYRGIKGAVDAALGGAVGPWTKLWRLVKFFTRYVILAAAAYVIVVRLRLHIVGVLAGASSFVLAVLVEAGRIVLAARRTGHA